MVSMESKEAPLAAMQLDPSLPMAVLHSPPCLDEETGCRLRQALEDAIYAGYRDLVVEVGCTSQLTASGVSSLVAAQEEFGCERGRIVLAGARPDMVAELQSLGLRANFPIYDDVEAAQSALFKVSIRQFAAIRENTVRLRTWLRSITSYHHIEMGDRERIEAAASEAFANAVSHATPNKVVPVRVRVVLSSVVLVEVQDRGAGFQARQYFTVDPALLHSGARGLGIYVMRNLMDSVEFVTGCADDPDPAAGTTVRLVKRLRMEGMCAHEPTGEV